jgi:hypothetical protein
MAAIALLSTLGTPLPAQAAALSLGGLTFSEVSGDYRLTGGRLDAGLFTLEQEVFGPNINLFMAIDGLLNACPYRGGCYFFVQSVVTNRTGTPWNFFDHELQEVFGVASPEADGLSFAQQYPEFRPFTANRYGRADEVTDVRDFVNFSGGTVAPGESVIFRYAIADTTPLNRFYLLQRPNFQVGGIGFVNPTPQPTPVVSPVPSPSPDPIPSVEPGPIDSGSDPDNSAAVPEPSTILGLLVFGAIAGGAKLKHPR